MSDGQDRQPGQATWLESAPKWHGSPTVPLPRERSSFPEGLLAPLSLAVTWRNQESRVLGALLDSILLVPQFVQKCNKIQNLKVQLFWPLGKNLDPKLSLREQWKELQKGWKNIDGVLHHHGFFYVKNH